MKKQKNLKFILNVFIALALNISFAMAAADFRVEGFSCTPGEVVVNSVFSCTATVFNRGDASSAITMAYLYDSDSWLQKEAGNDYILASSGVGASTSIAAGTSTSIVFSGLRATKSGNNGFSKIMLDSVTDTYVTDEKVNTINVLGTVSNSVSSANMGETVTSTASVSAGGDIDVVLTFSVTSGGCTISGQDSEKTISGMHDGNTASRSWTITMGSGSSARNCKYSIAAAATGTGGIASKIDTTSSTITCTDCSTDSVTGSSSTSGSGSGSGGGAGGEQEAIYLNSEQTKELSANEKIKFSILNEEHTLTVTNLSDTEITITIKSEAQTFTLRPGNIKEVDLNNDKKNEISVYLRSINIIKKKATLILTPLVKTEPVAGKTSDESVNKTGAKGGDKGEISGDVGGIGANIKALTGSSLNVIIIAVIIVLIILIVYFVFRKKRTE